MRRYGDSELQSWQRRRFLGMSVATLASTAALWGGLSRRRQSSPLSLREAAFYRPRQPGE